MKKIALVIIFAVMLSNMAWAELYLTFYGTMIQVDCGEPLRTGVSELHLEVSLNEEFARELGWNIDTSKSCRYYHGLWTVMASGLDTYIHRKHDGG